MGYGTIPLSEFQIDDDCQTIDITAPREPKSDETFYFVILTKYVINTSNILNLNSSVQPTTIKRPREQSSDFEYFLISLNSSITAVFITGFFPVPLLTRYDFKSSNKTKINLVFIPYYDTTYHILTNAQEGSVKYYTNSSQIKPLEPENEIFIRENNFLIISYTILPNSTNPYIDFDSMELHNDKLREQDYYNEIQSINNKYQDYVYSAISLGNNIFKILPTNQNLENYTDICLFENCAFITTPHMDGYIFAKDTKNSTIDLNKGFTNKKAQIINSTRYPFILLCRSAGYRYYLTGFKNTTIYFSKDELQFNVGQMYVDLNNNKFSFDNYKIQITSPTFEGTLRLTLKDTIKNVSLTFTTKSLFKNSLQPEYIKFDIDSDIGIIKENFMKCSFQC
ncbi:hypothetical protein TVAG_426260 [Trichomonas vaginalis G3]|uniref:Uncharacterized protein n=1 Tax=Trichomonas vaginalis (strain ATCC PRA-98 / G3) TaxID=412133 RepID=A2DYP3_TRIV3|nr:hypothetical protein TVAGG3_0850700 [Trichomonas vaginalis G3]EAY14433.1 hypothetical protein TVAG_426260 [Trichomonas vaginalis G3]KAI5499961.1 hypothetical protein TVAGG3_0850700 [Trichomonas vaginalis G3]|eukprot:XP_001326656.1 hypothetical protein [Trichomonas vaginalis G3]